MARNSITSGLSAQVLEKAGGDYRNGARILIRIVMFQAFVLVVLSILLAFYLDTRQSRDHFFAETGDNKIMQMVSLPLPNMGRAALSDWVANATSEILTFGFNDIDEKFAQSQRDFTPDGWKAFRKAVIISPLISDMLATQQILTTVPEYPPALKSEGMVDGVYSWTFEVPVLLTFRAGSDKRTRSKVVHVVVQKVPTADNPNAVGISEWYVNYNG
jgi:intracellular multiplication protein IcmL